MTSAQRALLPRAEEAISRARVRLLQAQAFFATVLFRHVFVADYGCPTLWIDGRSLGYNPQYVTSIPADHLVFWLAHEAVHVAGLHHLRRGDRDLRLWNIACDHVDNGILVRAGLTLPDGALAPRYDTTPEAIYAELDAQRRADEERAAQQQAQQQASQDDSSGGNAQDETGNDQSARTSPREGQQRTQQGSRVQDSGSPGSQDTAKSKQNKDLGGKKTPQNQPKSKQDKDLADENEGVPQDSDSSSAQPQPGEVRDQRNDDGTEMNAAERDIAEGRARVMLEQAIRAAKAAGQDPGAGEAFATKVITPYVDWREVTARFVDRLAVADWSYNRPNLRYPNPIMPTLSKPGLPRLALIGDSSGSMAGELDRVCSELRQCLTTYAEAGQTPTFHFLWADAVIAGHWEVTDEDDLPEPRGLGGTDFAPALQYIDEQQLDVDGIVYVTDGLCWSFGNEPVVPVLWLLTSTIDFRPPFGEVAHMPQRRA